MTITFDNGEYYELNETLHTRFVVYGSQINKKFQESFTFCMPVDSFDPKPEAFMYESIRINSKYYTPKLKTNENN